MQGDFHCTHCHGVCHNLGACHLSLCMSFKTSHIRQEKQILIRLPHKEKKKKNFVSMDLIMK